MNAMQKNSAPSRKKRAHIYYGLIVFSAFLLSASCTGMLNNFHTLFLPTVSEALQVTRSKLALFSTFGSITCMLTLPYASRLYQRYSLRLLALLGAVCGAGAHLLYSLATSVSLFYLGGILSGLCGAFAGTVPINLLLSNWFIKRRGFATGIVYTGSSLIASLFSPAVSQLLVQFGWRTAYRAVSVGLLLTALPFLLFARTKPADVGMSPYGQVEKVTTPLYGFTQKQTLRLRSYWLFALSIFLLGLLNSGTQQHLVAYWQTVGISYADAARVYSLVLLAGVAGKLIVGGLFDRFRAPAVLLFCFAVEFCALALLLACRSASSAYIPAFLFGMTTAFQIIFPAYLAQKFYGTRDFVANVGVILSILYLGASVGSPISALVFDLTGGYRLTWFLFSLLCIIAFASLLAATRLASRTPAENR